MYPVIMKTGDPVFDALADALMIAAAGRASDRADAMHVGNGIQEIERFGRPLSDKERNKYLYGEKELPSKPADPGSGPG